MTVSLYPGMRYDIQPPGQFSPVWSRSQLKTLKNQKKKKERKKEKKKTLDDFPGLVM